MKVLGILATFLFVLVCNVTSQGDLDLRCYSCGYIVYPNGTQTKIEDDVELCGDFATDNDNIVTAGVVRYKEYDNFILIRQILVN